MHNFPPHLSWVDTVQEYISNHNRHTVILWVGGSEKIMDDVTDDQQIPVLLEISSTDVESS